MVANYYKPGPATTPGNLRHNIASPSTRDGLADLGKWFIADNVVEGNDQVTADNWNGGVSARGGGEAIAALKLEKPWPAMAINQHTAKEAYDLVLKNVGATLPKRDSVDAPRIASGAGYNDIRNNVIYNWKNESVYGGEVHQRGNDKFVGCSTNLVANYYKPGPGTPAKNLTRICSPWSRDGAADYGKWYVADNYLVGSGEVTADNWKGVFPQYTGKIPLDLEAIPGLKLDSPSEFVPINQQTAEEAYISVLEHAGCSLPKRDAIDLRIIEEVCNGTAKYGDNGFIDHPSVVGGWPELKNSTAPVDTDHDGMPDDWETEKGLNPNDAADGNKVAANGYTMLEVYLNSLLAPPTS